MNNKKNYRLKNEEVILSNGKKGWFARNVSCTAIVIGIDKKKRFYILANERGKSLDFAGYENLPTGYINFYEDGFQCVVRETFEETGLKLNESYFVHIHTNTSPSANKQNINIRYKYNIYVEIEDNIPYITNIEKNEVSSVEWILLDNIHRYNWCFGHLELIKEYCKFERFANAHYKKDGNS